MYENRLSGKTRRYFVIVDFFQKKNFQDFASKKRPKILSKDSKGLQKIPKNSRGFQMIPDDSRGFQRIPEDSRGFQRIPEDSKGFQRIPKDSKGLMIPKKPKRFYNILRKSTLGIPKR